MRMRIAGWRMAAALAAWCAAAAVRGDMVEVNGVEWTYEVIWLASDDAVVSITGCTPTGYVTMPSNLGGWPVRIIGTNAFQANYDLYTMRMANGVTRIEEGAFNSCIGLGDVLLPNSLVSIGDNAFSYCSNLSGVALPDSVELIGNSAFEGCFGLLGYVVIPYRVTSIGNSAFYGCTSISGVQIGNSVVTIGDDAFFGCRAMVDVHLSDSVERIGANAFAQCSSLPTVTIPDSVLTVGDGAFAGCAGLESAKLGQSVAGIGKGVFSGCNKLRTLHVPATWKGTATLADAGIPQGCTIVYYGGEDEETVSSPVGVPHSWLDGHTNALAATGGDYEAAAVADWDGDGAAAWEEYVAGTNPEDKGDVFKVTGWTWKGGEMVPEYGPKDEETRTYTVEAADGAGGGYRPTAEMGAAEVRRFYRVRVEMK